MASSILRAWRQHARQDASARQQIPGCSRLRCGCCCKRRFDKQIVRRVEPNLLSSCGCALCAPVSHCVWQPFSLPSGCFTLPLSALCTTPALLGLNKW